MSWNKNLTQLNDAMALLLPFREDVLPILTEAGINTSQIRFDSKPGNLWFSIISYASTNGKIDRLVDTLLGKFPDNGYLKSFKDNYIYDIGDDIKAIDWHKPNNLERILGRASTLLPISFLSRGVEVSKCVVRILVDIDGNKHSGTGFLIDKNYILTNNHVLKSIEEARGATVQFNYEASTDGSPVNTVDFNIDTNENFETSIEDDWTIVKLAGDANTLFGKISLKSVTFETGDYVNIIQHPGGGLKKIGLYRNVLTYKDDNVVQYLTDTEPGSSGSPVFNSNWDVVALHNSSGMALEEHVSGSMLRNQGININKIDLL